VTGVDVARHPERVRRVIGMAGQYAAVEPTMTGRENLCMVARLFGQPRRQAATNTAAVLAQLGLDDVADRLVKTYSGGLRRRLDLGASLVGAPRLLLLDEPTTGLDPRSLRLQRLCAGRHLARLDATHRRTPARHRHVPRGACAGPRRPSYGRPRPHHNLLGDPVADLVGRNPGDLRPLAVARYRRSS
jgi:ABC-type transport system involved in cytochrome c biogenesis ATPase subunit